MTLRNVQNELLVFSHFLQTGLLTVVLTAHFFLCFFPFYERKLNILFLMPWYHHTSKLKFSVHIDLLNYLFSVYCKQVELLEERGKDIIKNNPMWRMVKRVVLRCGWGYNGSGNRFSEVLSIFYKVLVIFSTHWFRWVVSTQSTFHQVFNICNLII